MIFEKFEKLCERIAFCINRLFYCSTKTNKILSRFKVKGDVKGFAGGGVIIICKFNKFKDREKYFCKKAVNTDDKCPFENLSSKKDGRYSQYYNTSSATLHVHLTKLNLTDSGLYQFGTQNKNDKQSVSLSVNKGNITYITLL